MAHGQYAHRWDAMKMGIVEQITHEVRWEVWNCPMDDTRDHRKAKLVGSARISF